MLSTKIGMSINFFVNMISNYREKNNLYGSVILKVIPLLKY